MHKKYTITWVLAVRTLVNQRITKREILTFAKHKCQVLEKIP